MVKPCFLHALFIAAYMSLFIFSSHLQSALMISLPKKKNQIFLSKFSSSISSMKAFSSP